MDIRGRRLSVGPPSYSQYILVIQGIVLRESMAICALWSSLPVRFRGVFTTFGDVYHEGNHIPQFHLQHDAKPSQQKQF
jgi:hypothetical protein